jgi:hypothetical protein
MLDPDKAHAWVEEHFATVTQEEFVARVQRASPDLARELWGERSVAEICAEPPRPAYRGVGRVVTSLRRSVLRLFS